LSLDVPSVKNARVGLRALELVGIPFDRIVLILNRADSKVNLSARDVERALELKIQSRLPSDVVVTRSVNKGTPAVYSYPRSRFAQSIEQLAGIVRTRAAEAAHALATMEVAT